MKKAISCILTLCLLLALTVPFGVSAAEDEQDFLPVTGTFMQDWLYSNYTDEMLDDEFQKMKDMGIDLLYFNNMAGRGSAEDDWYFTYPTDNPDYEDAEIYDDVTRMMDYCKKYGIKFYLGLGLDDTWWSRDLSRPADAEWMKEVAQFSAFLVKDLYRMYEDEYGDVFGGYYWVYEIWNHHSWNNPTTRTAYADTLSTAFNIIIDAINETCPDKILWFSPFATREGFATKDNLTAFYTEFFSKTRFREQDAMAPMDNIGGGGQTIPYLDEWTKAYSDAFTASGTKLQFWSNCENFVQPKGDEAWASCTMDRFEQQLRITSKYCSKIISFSYNHYFSSNNIVPGFDKAYNDLLTKGELEKVKPSLPESAKITLGSASVGLKWDNFTDDYDIAKYTVERYNSTTKSFQTVFFTTMGRKDGLLNKILKMTTSYADTTYIKGKDAIYRIVALDCSGNASDPIYLMLLLDENGAVKDISSWTGEKGYLTQAEFNEHKEEIGFVEASSVQNTTSTPQNSTASKPENSKPAVDTDKEGKDSLIFLIIAISVGAAALLLAVFLIGKKKKTGETNAEEAVLDEKTKKADQTESTTEEA